MVPAIGDSWYRYYDGKGCIELAVFTVMHVSPKCVYLFEYPGNSTYQDKWVRDGCARVLQEARKRYAYPTRELAADSYRKRKSFQKAYIMASLEKCEKMVALMGEYGDIPESSLQRVFETVQSIKLSELFT